jgi:hypothetical protein
MRQPDQGFERAVHDLARGCPTDLGNQADTAGVVVGGYMTRTHLYSVYRQSRTEVQSRISMTLMDFLGSDDLGDKGLNHQGH